MADHEARRGVVPAALDDAIEQAPFLEWVAQIGREEARAAVLSGAYRLAGPPPGSTAGAW